MGQISTAQARVIDPVLTEVAQGYKQPGLVGNSLFPRVPVAARGGKVISFNREDMKTYNNLLRAPGAATGRVIFGHGSSTYALDDFSIEGQVPIEHAEDAEAVPGIDMAAIGVSKAMQIILNRLEIQQAGLATTAATYAAANKVTLSGTGQWSDYSGTSNPMVNVETAKEAVRAATGMLPNTVVMSAAVYSKCRAHPAIVDRIKHTGRDVATPELLAALFGVERVEVGGALISNDAETSFTDVWGKFVVVAYTATESLRNRGTPSFGYTYTLNGYPFAEEAYYERPVKSWLFPATSSEKPVIVNANAGYLISAAIA